MPEEDRRNATEMYNPTTLKALKETYGVRNNYYFLLVLERTVRCS